MKTAIALIVFISLTWVFTAEADLVTVSGVVRDFWPCTNNDNCGKYGVNLPPWSEYYCNVSYCMPDFEAFGGSGEPGIILDYLDSNRKPIYNNATSHDNIAQNGKFFPLWWNTAPGYNLQYIVNLTLDNTICFGACPLDGKTYGYKNESYFPLSDRGFGNYGPDYSTENFSFCLELHLRFTYRGVELFSFTGDDDLWVFINGHLVIDLGGLHSALSATVQLNTTQVLSDMVIGQNYPFDMFYCERHTSQSDLALYTDLALTCPYYDWCGICQGNGQSCCTCDDGNVCTTDTCNVTTGQCITTTIICPGSTSDLCHPQVCDPTEGCQRTTLNCTDNDLCTTDSCSASSGCSHVKLICNDGNTCTTDSCNEATGKCQYIEVATDPCSGEACKNGVPPIETHVCNTTNLCSPLSCVNNECVIAYNVSCDDQNPCTIDHCDALTGNCSYTQFPCDDKSVCTLDTCNSTTGKCVFTPIVCEDNNACTTNMCNATSGCYYPAIVFATVSNCTTSYCDAVVGIVTSPIVCRPTDRCHCSNNNCVCTNFLANLSTGAKIGAGVIAAIIIGAVVAAIIFAIVGKKGYDYYQTKHVSTSALKSNPLYAEKAGNGTNPMYDANI